MLNVSAYNFFKNTLGASFNNNCFAKEERTTNYVPFVQTNDEVNQFLDLLVIIEVYAENSMTIGWLQEKMGEFFNTPQPGITLNEGETLFTSKQPNQYKYACLFECLKKKASNYGNIPSLALKSTQPGNAWSLMSIFLSSTTQLDNKGYDLVLTIIFNSMTTISYDENHGRGFRLSMHTKESYEVGASYSTNPTQLSLAIQSSKLFLETLAKNGCYVDVTNYHKTHRLLIDKENYDKYAATGKAFRDSYKETLLLEVNVPALKK